MSHIPLASVDMRVNFAAAAAILIVVGCAVVVSSRRQPKHAHKSRRWIPLASLVAGPVIAFCFWGADVFVINVDMYPTAFKGDALATLSSVMILGSFVGFCTSIVFVSALSWRPGANP